MGEPIRLTDSATERLLRFLEDELPKAENDVLNKLNARRMDFDDIYFGRVRPRLADWMSNFPVLLGATFTDAILARIVNTIHAYRPIYMLEPTRDSGWKEVSSAVERYLEFHLRRKTKFYRELKKTLYECVRLGTGAMITPWHREVGTRMKRTGLWNRPVDYVKSEGVTHRSIPIRHLLYPAGYSELEDLPWWARRLYWNEIYLRRNADMYDYVDEALKQQGPLDEHEQAAKERSDVETGTIERVQVWETWLWFDLEKKGKYQKYTIWWNPRIRKIMRAERDEGDWPLRIFRYGPRDHDIHGLGVIEATEPFEQSLYNLYNLLVDNFRVATMQCFAAAKGQGISHKTKLYPGKIFLFNDPQKDFQSMTMGQPYVLNPTFTRSIWDLGERRAGVSDYALGRESPIVGRHATATGTMALIQEGQRRFDLTIADIRDELDDHGMYILKTTHKNGQDMQPYMFLGEDGQWVQQWLQMPADPPDETCGLVSSVSRAVMNKDVEKNDAIITFKILGEFYQQITQGLMMLASPETPQEMKPIIVKMIQGGALKMKQVLEAHGEIAPDVYTDLFKQEQPQGQPPPQEEAIEQA